MISTETKRTCTISREEIINMLNGKIQGKQKYFDPENTEVYGIKENHSQQENMKSISFLDENIPITGVVVTEIIKTNV